MTLQIHKVQYSYSDFSICGLYVHNKYFIGAFKWEIVTCKHCLGIK